MIRLTMEQYEQILNHARTSFPLEVCGLLAGRTDGTQRVVEKVYLMSNIDQSSEHFSMDPGEQFAAVKDMRQHAWVMLGNFHSHPATPARPSEEDKRLAYDPGLSYLILSLAEPENPVLKSFRIRAGEVDAEEIIISGKYSVVKESEVRCQKSE